MASHRTRNAHAQRYQPAGCGRNTVVRSPHPDSERENRENGRGYAARARARQRTILEPKRQVLGCPGRLKGLAAGIVISWCCCKQLLAAASHLPHAESVLETTRGCPAAMMYAPSDVSISKTLHVFRAAAPPHRGGSVIGVQLRYPRMCCTRRRVCRRARADAAGRSAPLRFGPSPTLSTPAAVFHHRRRAAGAETTGALQPLAALRSPIVGYGFLARGEQKQAAPSRETRRRRVAVYGTGSHRTARDSRRDQWR